MKTLAFLVILAGCAQTAPPSRGEVAALPSQGVSPPESEPPVFGAGNCDAAPARRLIGRPASAVIVAQAVAATGSRTRRVILPNTAVTQDYRTDRLNIDVSASGTITRLWCG